MRTEQLNVVGADDPRIEPTSNLEILSSAEAADYLRSAKSTLAKLRCYGGGPKFVRQSARKILYRRIDLDEWLTSRTQSSTLRP